MYYYAPDNNRTGRRAGLIAAACYLATFLAVSLFVSFRTEYERPAEGILIDFGDDSDGSGTQNVALSETEEAASRPDTSQEEYLTQETEPAPVITTGSQRQQQTEHTPAEQERQVNRRALSRAGAPPRMPLRRAPAHRRPEIAGTNRAVTAAVPVRERETKASPST